MLHRRQFLSSLGAGVIVSGAGWAATPDRDALRALLATTVGTNGQVAGRIGVVIDATGAATAAVGSSGAPGVALDGNTVMEVGSIAKVLTALLLADMVARGEVAFDDPVGNYLPAEATLHVRGRPITLLDLATYSSSLPNMPGNLPPRWWTLPNPYAGYTRDKFYAFLSGYAPQYPPGAHYQYANLGFALLGHALARRAGKGYPQLLTERVCDPLGLRETRITPTEAMHRHLAQGHDPETLKPAPAWDAPDLPEMVGLHSTAHDLTRLLESAMGRRPTPLAGAFARLLATRRLTPVSGTEVGLGWFISSNARQEIVWKSGLTGGFASFIGFSTRTGRGAVLLSNGGYVAGAGFRMIDPEFDPGDLDSILR